MVYALLFFSSSKCSLFHNSNVFGFCIIHILYKGCAKIKKKNNSGAKRLTNSGSHLILPPSHLETDGYKLRYALTIMTVFETLHDKAHVCTGRHTVEYYVMCARSVIYGGIYEGIKVRLGWTPSPYLQSSD